MKNAEMGLYNCNNHYATSSFAKKITYFENKMKSGSSRHVSFSLTTSDKGMVSKTHMADNTS